MIYALIAALLTGFGAGAWSAHEWNKAELWRLQSALRGQQAEAADMLAVIGAKIDQQKRHQEAANEELESARQSSIATINAYHAQLGAVLLRAAGARPRGPDAVPEAADSAGVHENEAGYPGFSEEVAEVIGDDAFRADALAVDFNALLDFVHSDCGFAQVRGGRP